MGVLMKKNLGKKRFELSADCQRRIVETYHAFKTVDWTASEAIGGRVRTLKAKVLPTSHFFYRKVTIERPQRMRFDLTEERLPAFFADPAQAKLNDAGVLAAALNRIVEKTGAQTYMSADAFRAALQDADTANAKDAKEKPTKLKPKQLEVARKFFGVRDKKAVITTNEKGEVIPDTDLRDAEYIPFSVVGDDVSSGVATYFDAEVKPHWPDAWMNEDVRDGSDGQIGVVGCEINFNREFYIYVPPRSREEIKKDIEAMEKRFMEMLKGVAG
jgi:type I restriction enzyme M protein